MSQVLVREGFRVYGVDASAKLIAAGRERFPDADAARAGVEESEFRNRTSDAVVAGGGRRPGPGWRTVRRGRQSLLPCLKAAVLR